jgi:hypothetical protein
MGQSNLSYTTQLYQEMKNITPPIKVPSLKLVPKLMDLRTVEVKTDSNAEKVII